MESEVLGLFAEHASESLATIGQSPNEAAREAAAHRLVGAARAIGANKLADVAEEIEQLAELSPKVVDALSDAMAAVVDVLEDRISREIDQP